MGVSVEFQGLISKIFQVPGRKIQIKFGKNQIQIQLKTTEKPLEKIQEFQESSPKKTKFPKDLGSSFFRILQDLFPSIIPNFFELPDHSRRVNHSQSYLLTSRNLDPKKFLKKFHLGVKKIPGHSGYLWLEY